MARPKRAVGERSFGGELRGLESHAQGAARARGLDRVTAQVHHHLVQLGGIADHHERPLRGARLQTDGGGKRAAQQLERLGHDLPDVDRCALAELAAAVS